MNHTKTIKRDDGSRVRIKVLFNSGIRSSYWSHLVQTCEKSKRTWRSVGDYEFREYRHLSREDREELTHQDQLRVVTSEELHEAKLELWQKMKPVMEGK